MDRVRLSVGVGLALVLVMAFTGRMPAVTDAVPRAQATPESSPAATPGGTPSAGVTIKIVDFKFEPATVTVKVGTTVTWVNDGPTIHTTTAYGAGGTKIWDSKILERGQSFSYTFDQPGSFDYLCTLHPSMKARLDVEG